MTRVLQPELLDELPATDPRAIHSRRDLRRINVLMRNPHAITNYVRNRARSVRNFSPIVIAEIGAGDGIVASHLARELSTVGIFGTVLLIDRQPSSPSPTVSGWSFDTIKADIFDWSASAQRVDVIISNLFLHHFEDQRLRELLNRCAGLCRIFAAAEPCRNKFAEWFARRLKWIGCNDVTRHDAEISVRAGFICSELSTLWPNTTHWSLTEHRAGLFTHFFGATREQ